MTGMKIGVSFFALFIILSSCSSGKEENIEAADFSADKFPVEYVLTEYSTMLPGSNVTGDDLPYREKYIFKEDLTFIKSRTEDNKTFEAEGKFSRIDINNNMYFKLVYNSKHELVESCSSKDTEYLIIDSPDKIRGTANACDYPSKTYERV